MHAMRKIVFYAGALSLGLFGESANAFCPPGRICPQQPPAPVRPAPGTWYPYASPSYYQQQSQNWTQAYRQIQQNPYVISGGLAWNGVKCAGGAIVVAGTDGLGLPVLANTGYSCTQAGLAAWRYGQALGR